jgi:hypothetical protein
MVSMTVRFVKGLYKVEVRQGPFKKPKNTVGKN